MKIYNSRKEGLGSFLISPRMKKIKGKLEFWGKEEGKVIFKGKLQGKTSFIFMQIKFKVVKMFNQIVHLLLVLWSQSIRLMK